MSVRFELEHVSDFVGMRSWLAASLVRSKLRGSTRAKGHRFTGAVKTQIP